MAVLFDTGDQVPVKPSLEVVGRVSVPPEQMGDTAGNVGVVFWFTVTVYVVVVAHCPAEGVNV